MANQPRAAEKDAPAEHRHYWTPVPAYRRVGDESSACACGALHDGTRVIPPGQDNDA